MSTVLILTGAPGAGKGTQADLIAERLAFRKISTGDVLRKHIKIGTDIGKKAETLIVGGNLVPDDVLFEIVKEELKNSSNSKILLDGYPRTLNQAKDLKTLAAQHPVKAAIHLEVDKNELIARLSGRRICGQCGKSFHVKFSPPKKEETCDECQSMLVQRADDNPAKVSVRLDVYERETRPVLDFYKEENVLNVVDGMGETEEVYKRLKAMLDSVICDLL